MATRGLRIGILLLTAAAILVACSSGSRSAPAPAGPAQIVQHGDATKPVVALTFDAGYEQIYTDQILDILKQEGVKASFGITGVWATDYPDLLKRIAAEGHDIFNHSYHHWSFTGQSAQNAPLTEQQIRDELDTTDAVIKKLTGVSTRPYFRPPYGDRNDAVDAAASADGYTYDVLWSNSSQGWQGGSTDDIVQRVVAQVHPGAIITMHLGVAEDAYALKPIIDGLRSAGYGFVTLPEMIAAQGG
jgi:peptidoglycan/xylan/chitin deacetylase (PgdA/CDA1 family)